jgi:putative ABC transport system permease protein
MGEFFRRIYYLVHRRKLERELASDIEFHREMMGTEYRKDFGNTLRLREQSREAWGWMWLDHFVQDLRYGFRTLRNNPSFTLVAMLALGLGIGANTALFSVVYGVLLKPLPYAQGHELVVLHQQFAGTERGEAGFSVKEITDYREQSKSLAQIEEFHLMSFILLGGQEPDEVRTGVVSAHFFDLLGIKPYLGRLFTDSDDKPGADAVLVLSYPYWQKRYGGDPNIIGRHFRMNDKVHTVIGVLPSIPQYPRENDVYMPTVACPFRSAPTTIADRKSRMLRVFGRLKPDTNIESAKADISRVAAGMQKANPADYPMTLKADMEGLQQQLTQRVRPMLLILLATAGLVLLIACANVANLALARTMRREQELAVRAAMGASRGRLVRQLLTESTLLSLAGGGVGLLLASGCLDLLVRFVAGFTTRAAEVSISTPVLLFTLVVSVVTGLVFGSVPAFFQRLDLVNSLKEGTNTASERSSRHTVRNALVMGQVALSFMLLIGAGLMIRSFVRLQHVNAGYDSDNVLTATVPLNFSKYRNQKTVGAFFEQVTQKLEGTAGIQAVAANSSAPLSSQGMRMTVHFVIENHPTAEKGPGPEADANIVSPGAFRVLGIPLISGRVFTRQDTKDKPVVIISRSLARHYFQNENPIHQRIAVDDDDGKQWLTIVGVVGDVKQYGLEQDPVDTIYAPMTLSPNVGTLLVKTAGDPRSYTKQVREAVYSVDPEQPIGDVKTLDELRGDSMAATRLTSILLAMFAGLALAIAATGLSGVTALLVSQRTREIGIRMALGAQRASVLQMFVKQAMKVIVSGLAIGLVGALVGSRLIQGLLYSTAPTDPLTFVGVALLFVAVALVASYVPARRISKVSPLIALRSE